MDGERDQFSDTTAPGSKNYSVLWIMGGMTMEEEKDPDMREFITREQELWCAGLWEG